VTIHPTREALWEQHVFESLLEWCNGRFLPDRVILLIERDGQPDGTRLYTKAQVEHLGYAEYPSLPLMLTDAII